SKATPRLNSSWTAALQEFRNDTSPRRSPTWGLGTSWAAVNPEPRSTTKNNKVCELRNISASLRGLKFTRPRLPSWFLRQTKNIQSELPAQSLDLTFCARPLTLLEPLCHNPGPGDSLTHRRGGPWGFTLVLDVARTAGSPHSGVHGSSLGLGPLFLPSSLPPSARLAIPVDSSCSRLRPSGASCFPRRLAWRL